MSSKPAGPQPEKKREPDPGKPQYKGGAFDQIDVPSITSFLACLLLFVLILIGVKSVDYSRLNKVSLNDVSDRIAKIIMPLKPIGKPAARPKPPSARGSMMPHPIGGNAGPSADEGSAAARIERSRKVVTEQIGKIQERVTKAAVLSILAGKGPATAGRAVGKAGNNNGFGDWGDLDSKLGSLEGLTKYDGKKGNYNQDGAPPPSMKGDAIGQTSGIDKLVKGFQNAKVSALKKIGSSAIEPPELMDHSNKYKGTRNLQDVGAFITKKQSLITMLYEERLKVNPTLAGKVTVVMVIEDDGTVSSASILRSETNLDDQEFLDALLRRIKRWVFPPTTGGAVEMKSPFVFTPS